MAERQPRYRNLTFLIYPESANEKYMDILKESHIPMYLSLHNKDSDLGHEEEDRKDHIHVLVMFDSPQNPNVLDDLIERVGGVKPPLHTFVVRNLRSMARYLTHMDQPEKYQYYKDKDHKVIELNGVKSYEEMCKSAEENKMARLEMTKDIMDYAYKHNITSFSEMCKHCADNDLNDWLDLLMWQNSFGFSSYFKNSSYIDGFTEEVKNALHLKQKYNKNKEREDN